LEIEKLLNALTSHDNVLYLFSVNHKCLFILEYLSANLINFGTAILGAIPYSARQPNLVEKFLYTIRNPYIFLSKYVKSEKHRVIKQPPADFVIIGGSFLENKVKELNFFGQNTKIIKAHSLDYDLYLEEEKVSNNHQSNEEYILFIDEFGPYHPDILFNENRKPDVKSKTYFSDINIFFNRLECETGIMVLIAAHPRSDYTNIGNPYGKRKIISGETIKLVKNAKFVVAHASTAISFAVLYNKPIILLSSPDYSKRYNHGIKALGKELNVIILNVSKPFFLPNNYLNTDELSYNEYIDKYIKSDGTLKKNVWEIFTDFIEEENNSNREYKNKHAEKLNY